MDDARRDPAPRSATAGPAGYAYRYSDLGSKELHDRRAATLAVALVAGLFLFLATCALGLGASLVWGGSPAGLAAVAVGTAFALVAGGLAAVLVVFRHLRGAVERGVSLTDRVLHVRGRTIPVPAIVRAEMVSLEGDPSPRLAIDYVAGGAGGRRVRTILLRREETADYRALWDAIRAVKGWPPSLLATATTRRAWRESARALAPGGGGTGP